MALEAVTEAPSPHEKEGKIKKPRKPRNDYEPDEGISISCLTTAKRHGHTQLQAERCEFDDLHNGGGTVGCPTCPYKRSPSSTITPHALRSPLG
jgi:hypothetical protein